MAEQRAKRSGSRKVVARVVVRALLEAAGDGEITFAVVGRIVGRIIRAWPTHSDRQRAAMQKDWMDTLRAEVRARDLGGRSSAARHALDGVTKQKP